MRIAGDMIAELMPYINKMTNWQRNQWARAGYPIEITRLKYFLALKKP